jgi:hypothetical protein
MREPHMSGPDRDDDGQTGVATKTRAKTKRPPLYKVLMLNDDYTPMEFVVYVLEHIGGRYHVDGAYQGAGGSRSFLVRDRRNQGRPGHGTGAAQPASAAMHAGKGIGPRPVRR